MDNKLAAFAKVLQTMDELRSQCPWDKAQTNESLRLLTIEETYELADAVLSDSFEDIKYELGDILLHIVFYSKIAEEKEQFNFADVCDSLVKKLHVRHPHIYGDVKVNDAEDVKQNWEEIKIKTGNKSVFSGVPDGLPTLIKSIRIQDKAHSVGFDWDNKEQVWDKVEEELAEFKSALSQQPQDSTHQEHEFGDILFTLVNYARFWNINVDNALERANLRFINRFKKMEEIVISENKDFRNMTIDEMETRWQQAKKELGHKD